MEEGNRKVIGRIEVTTVISSDHLIGLAPVANRQREGYQASHAVEQSTACRVSVRASAANAWNQNWNASNPGNQNNNNKTNLRRVRAVRRTGVTKYA